MPFSFIRNLLASICDLFARVPRMARFVTEQIGHITIFHAGIPREIVSESHNSLSRSLCNCSLSYQGMFEGLRNFSPAIVYNRAHFLLLPLYIHDRGIGYSQQSRGRPMFPCQVLHAIPVLYIETVLSPISLHGCGQQPNPYYW